MDIFRDCLFKSEIDESYNSTTGILGLNWSGFPAISLRIFPSESGLLHCKNSLRNFWPFKPLIERVVSKLAKTIEQHQFKYLRRYNDY